MSEKATQARIHGISPQQLFCFSPLPTYLRKENFFFSDGCVTQICRKQYPEYQDLVQEEWLTALLQFLKSPPRRRPHWYESVAISHLNDIDNWDVFSSTFFRLYATPFPYFFMIVDFCSSFLQLFTQGKSHSPRQPFQHVKGKQTNTDMKLKLY